MTFTRSALLLALAGSALALPSTGPNDKRQLLGGLIPITGGTFDYIVVGGGTSGATLAARIAEDPNVTVALLEAGDGSCGLNPLAFIPGADVLGVGSDPADTQTYDWQFVTEPQAGAGGRRIHYARGKCLGGSSQRNFMIYQRPTSDSFDFWVNATSGQPSPGWKWEDVYPYYTKSGVLSPADNAQRGSQYAPQYNPAAYPETDPKAAPLSLGYPNYAFPYSGYLQRAFNELGYPNATDFNSGTLNGVQYDVATIRHSDGHRATSQFFLDNAASRPNLKVITNALAKKVNFDDKKNAVSVTYVDSVLGLATVTIGASREIILSAGAFQSPQLLMVSGIGPRAQLQKFNIPVLVDLPGVGQNMQDHIFFSPGYEIRDDIYNFGHESQLLDLVASAAGFLFTNSGPLTNHVADFLGWQRLNGSFFESHPEARVLESYPKLWPHVEYLGAGGLTGNFTSLLAENFGPGFVGRFYYSLLGALVAPLSRGTVSLKSADTKDLPAIDPAWLTSPGDQAVAIELFRKIRRLFNTNAFKEARSNADEFFPGYSQDTDAEILKVIQNSLLTVWHASCTCAMQPRSNNGVVDPYLRVYGVQRLRIADASIFPSLPPGHPQSTCYMVGERAADLLKQTRGAPITTTRRSPPQGDSGVPYSGPN